MYKKKTSIQRKVCHYNRCLKKCTICCKCLVNEFVIDLWLWVLDLMIQMHFKILNFIFVCVNKIIKKQNRVLWKKSELVMNFTLLVWNNDQLFENFRQIEKVPLCQKLLSYFLSNWKVSMLESKQSS